MRRKTVKGITFSEVKAEVGSRLWHKQMGREIAAYRRDLKERVNQGHGDKTWSLRELIEMAVERKKARRQTLKMSTLIETFVFKVRNP